MLETKHGGLKPDDFSDVAEARVFCNTVTGELIFTDSFGWMQYDGQRWVASAAAARKLAHTFTDNQIKDASKYLKELHGIAAKAKVDGDTERAAQAGKDIEIAEHYLKFARRVRNTSRLNAMLTESEAILWTDTDALDADSMVLNCEDGTYDLRSGDRRDHDADDLITKMCAGSPDGSDTHGRELWEAFLAKVTGGDGELVRYLQMVSGMAAVGRVFSEVLVLAYGQGGTGKSTFFNTIHAMLGSYSQVIPAELLLCGKDSGKHQTVLLKGARMALCGELESDAEVLSTSAMKRLTSRDPIYGELKFRNGFWFQPSHTIFLYSNHLPQVRQTDSGTTDRLRVVPFDQRIRGTAGEVKDYEGYLIRNAGKYILHWIIQGAVMFLKAGGVLPEPAAVKDLSEKYVQEFDSIGNFLEEYTIAQPGGYVQSRVLYRQYEAYCKDRGERPRSETRFGIDLTERRHLKRDRKGGCRIWLDIVLKSYVTDEFGIRQEDTAKNQREIDAALQRELMG